MLDYGSVLMAAALSGACLGSTLIALWFSARESNFVLYMALAAFLFAIDITAFWQYSQQGAIVFCMVFAACLTFATYCVLQATCAYVDVRQPHALATRLVLVSVVLELSLIGFGFDGVAIILTYIVASLQLAISGWLYVTSTNIDRRLGFAIGGLALLNAGSLLTSAGVLVWRAQWIIGRAPDNWAEDVNNLISVASITALGAMTMTLHHVSSRRMLVTESLTDPMTGLKNRRALAAYGDAQFGPSSAVIVFDLDHFKRTNDVFGHAVGDVVLQRFGQVIRNYTSGFGAKAHGFRLGGEEFVVVIAGLTPAQIEELARSIVVAFGAEVVQTPLGPLRSTVSAGVAIGNDGLPPLDKMINIADEALYAAKEAGRNRVSVGGKRAPSSQPQEASDSPAATANRLSA